MNFHIMNLTLIKEYIKKTKILTDILGDSELEVTEIGDGNINYIFLIKSHNNSIIIKHSIPYLRCVGETWKLSPDRIKFEVSALKKYYNIFPNHVPKIYHIDSELNLFAMQHLDKHTVLRKELIAGKKNKNFINNVANFLAETSFKTSSYYLTSTEKRILEQEFIGNHDLCKLSENVIFTFPYFSHKSNNIFSGMEKISINISKNRLLKQKILDLKYAFMNQRDTLLHGDLHTGSIMLNEQETFIIDPEFAFFGPFGFDTGIFIANLILSYIQHYICDKNKGYSFWLLRAISEFWKIFSEKFLSFCISKNESSLITQGYYNNYELSCYYKQITQQILCKTIGYSGCEIARRILGLAGVADIRRICKSEQRLKAEKMALNIAITFLEKYDQINTIDNMIDIICKTSKNRTDI